jgi:hypothetical protein
MPLFLERARAVLHRNPLGRIERWTQGPYSVASTRTRSGWHSFSLLAAHQSGEPCSRRLLAAYVEPTGHSVRVGGKEGPLARSGVIPNGPLIGWEAWCGICEDC